MTMTMTMTTLRGSTPRRGTRIILGLVAATRRWRDRGALLPAGAGPWGDYAGPDRDRDRFLTDLRVARPI